MCVTHAGRNDRPSKTTASVDWIAYQGAPPGGVTDRVRISAWWTGTTCKTIAFPQVNVKEISTVGFQIDMKYPDRREVSQTGTGYGYYCRN